MSARTLKRAVLRTCELLGLFWLTRRSLRNRLQILCYHGFQLEDECAFRPQLFIARETFAERLRHIAAAGFEVLALEEAVARLRAGSLPPRAMVITIDDGFFSTLTVAAPLLKKAGFPATTYVTTYYVEKALPVFRLAVQYLFWKHSASGADYAALALLLPGLRAEQCAQDLEGTCWKLIRHGEACPSEAQRQSLLQQIAGALGVDLQRLLSGRVVDLMTAAEVRELASLGFDIQLHTHRHRFPAEDRVAATREIEENRASLQALTGRRATHFCYPSGLFEEHQWPWLQALEVASATTCLPGINERSTPPLGLRRFLDSEAIAPIEFRAELAGFNELLRRVRRRLTLGRRTPMPERMRTT